MSIKNFPRRIRALNTFTVPDAGVSGDLVHAGQVVDITEHMYRATAGTDGQSWLDLSPQEQISKYGEQRFAVEETS